MRAASLIQGNKALVAQQNWNAAAFLLSSFPEVQLQAGHVRLSQVSCLVLGANDVGVTVKTSKGNRTMMVDKN